MLHANVFICLIFLPLVVPDLGSLAGPLPFAVAAKTRKEYKVDCLSPFTTAFKVNDPGTSCSPVSFSFPFVKRMTYLVITPCLNSRGKGFHSTWILVLLSTVTAVITGASEGTKI